MVNLEIVRGLDITGYFCCITVYKLLQDRDFVKFVDKSDNTVQVENCIEWQNPMLIIYIA